MVLRGSTSARADGSAPLRTIPKDVVTELILDSSGSMKQKVQGRTKLFMAKRVLRAFMTESRTENMTLGLRVYGQKEKDCKDSKLILKFGKNGEGNGQDAIDSAIDSVDPKGYGKTPLAYSLEEAEKDLKKHPNKPKRIIVVTDGVETCHGDPCKIAKKLKDELDVKIYVVGYALDDKDREQLNCLSSQTGGKYFDASDLKSLLDTFKDLSKQNNNLIVKSPDPLAIARVYRLNDHGSKTLVSEFVSSLGTHVDPNIPYEVDVYLKPIYTFPRVVLAPKERKVLVVKGTGKVDILFMKKYFNIALLNDDGKPVVVFPSDAKTEVPVGFYKAKATAPPFAETMIDDIQVTPGGMHEERIRGFGVLQIDADKSQGAAPFGYYVFDDRKKADLGSYITGVPVVLPSGRYTIKSAGNTIIKNVYIDTDAMRHIPLPPPGQTVLFSLRAQDQPESKESDKKAK